MPPVITQGENFDIIATCMRVVSECQGPSAPVSSLLCQELADCKQILTPPPRPVPEPQSCQENDCGIYGPHYVNCCCPAYHQHPNTWCDSALGWGKAHCECLDGAATPPPAPHTPSGPSMTLTFSGGTSVGIPPVPTVVTVAAANGRSASNNVPSASTAAGCAVTLVNTARQLGLETRNEGFAVVRIWGAKKVFVSGQCSVACSTPDCSM